MGSVILEEVYDGDRLCANSHWEGIGDHSSNAQKPPCDRRFPMDCN